LEITTDADSQAAEYTIRYVSSARARNLRITIRPDCSVAVTIPRRASKPQVQEFVASRHAWIQKHLSKFKQRQPKHLSDVELSKTDIRQAQSRLFEKLESFSRRHQLPYKKAAFRCQKTKWGSCCKTTGSISLNINMVKLPEHLQDYLLLHELTHLLHPNHSPAFWKQLDSYCSGKAKLLSKELKTYPINLLRS
jgi:predicted metal-dependent hydrolase